MLIIEVTEKFHCPPLVLPLTCSLFNFQCSTNLPGPSCPYHRSKMGSVGCASSIKGNLLHMIIVEILEKFLARALPCPAQFHNFIFSIPTALPDPSYRYVQIDANWPSSININLLKMLIIDILGQLPCFAPCLVHTFSLFHFQCSSSPARSTS